MRNIIDKKIKVSLLKILLSQLFLSVLELANIYLLYKVLLAIIDYIKSSHEYVVVKLSDFVSISLDFQTTMFLLLGFTIFKLVLTLLSNKVKHEQIVGISEYISNRIFNRYYNTEYIYLKSVNTSSILQHVRGEPVFLTRAIISSSSILSEAFILSGLFLTMIVLEPKLTSILFTTFFVFSAIFYISIKSKMSTLGKERYKNEEILVSSIIQIFDGIREIILFKKKPYFESIFLRINRIRHAVVASNNYFLELPKVYLELVLNIGIVVGAFYFSTLNTNDYNFDGLIFIVLAGFRIIPSITKVISSLQDISFNSSAVKKIDKLLSAAPLVYDDTDLKDYKFSEIKLVNISFSYPSGKEVLNNLSFTIYSNTIVGIYGKSGSGKSTLIDLISNLISFNEGDILIDNIKVRDFNKNYNIKVGYVSQKPYLLNASLMENILLGSELDETRLLDIVSKVNLDFVRPSIQDLNNFRINEGSSNLSGGQVQRVALARALYQEPSLLLLDEFTSALDEHNEEKLLQVILKIKLTTTVILISHKKSTLDICDTYIELT